MWFLRSRSLLCVPLLFSSHWRLCCISVRPTIQFNHRYGWDVLYQCTKAQKTKTQSELACYQLRNFNVADHSTLHELFGSRMFRAMTMMCFDLLSVFDQDMFCREGTGSLDLIFYRVSSSHIICGKRTA